MVKNWRGAVTDASAQGLQKGLNKELGRGRDLLFGHDDVLRDTVSLRLVDIAPNPDQPRRHFDADELRNLAESLKQVGQLAPVLVKPDPQQPKHYRLVAGERRWRAAELAGLHSIMAHILPAEADGDQVALIENLQRVGLSPVEEAEGIRRLIERHGYSQERAGDLLGRSRTEINTTLTLLKLHADIRHDCVTSHATVPKALLLELARMDEPGQRAAWKQVSEGGTLTVRGARAARQGAAPSSTDGQGAAPARRFLAALPKLQKQMQAGIDAAVQSGAATLTDAERDSLRTLRADLDRYRLSLDALLGE
jgi:ParB family transcriptional regulator, chromosome partitioning protein